jgi:hypothetical protein
MQRVLANSGTGEFWSEVRWLTGLPKIKRRRRDNRLAQSVLESRLAGMRDKGWVSKEKDSFLTP